MRSQSISRKNTFKFQGFVQFSWPMKFGFVVSVSFYIDMCACAARWLKKSTDLSWKMPCLGFSCVQTGWVCSLWLTQTHAWILALIQMCWFPFPNSWKYFTYSIVYIDVYLRWVRSLLCSTEALLVYIIVLLLPGDQWINVKLFTVMCMYEINKRERNTDSFWSRGNLQSAPSRNCRMQEEDPWESTLFLFMHRV